MSGQNNLNYHIRTDTLSLFITLKYNWQKVHKITNYEKNRMMSCKEVLCEPRWGFTLTSFLRNTPFEKGPGTTNGDSSGNVGDKGCTNTGIFGGHRSKGKYLIGTKLILENGDLTILKVTFRQQNEFFLHLSEGLTNEDSKVKFCFEILFKFFGYCESFLVLHGIYWWEFSILNCTQK